VIGPFESIANDYGPLAIVTQIWEAEGAGRNALVPEELRAAATGGVHGEHDVVLHRPVVVGEPLATWVAAHGMRPAGRNSLVTLRFETRDADAVVVAEQWWTTVWLGVTCDATGDPPPAHAFPDEARARPTGEHVIAIDPDMARRYAEVSGDWSAHHFDLDAAKRTGFDRLFLHGLCTMTLCAQAIAGDDPDRLRRVAVRFAAPTFLGEQLIVRVYDAGPLGYAFEAESAGALVITHGRAEVR
jgi:acyl dehydratase